MKTALINNKSFLKDGYRFDPDIHLSEGVAIRRILRELPFELSTVGDNAERVFLGNIFSRIFVKSPEYGVPYLAASDTVMANLDNGRFLAKAQANQLHHLKLEKDWILVTCSGTLGNVSFTNSTFENRIATHDLIRIVPNSKYVNKGTLYAFLSSKYGYYQITQSQFGGVVKHINDTQAKDILVPVFPLELQEEVNNLVNASARLREEAIDAFNNAIKIFEDNLVKSKFDFSYQTKSISSASISGAFKRFDAQYQIGMQRLRKELTGVKTIKLSKLASKIYVGNRGKRYYVKSGIPFLSSSDMMLYNPVKYSTPISVNTPNLETLLVNTNDILISRSGTVGNSVIVSDTLNRKAVSEHALRLVIDNSQIDSRYIFCYLNTTHGKRVLEALAYGSVIITLGEEFVGDIDIPILSPEIQSAINEAIGRYSSCMDKSILFDNQAVKLIEKCIEENN